MGSDAWHEIEQLFLEGLHASETVRTRLLSDVAEPHVVGAVRQLWADAAAAPSSFLHDDHGKALDSYKVHDVVGERFTLEALLGSGGMGDVYGAIDTRLDRPVALKFLNPRLVQHPSMRGLIEHEARAVCRLAGHPNVCTVYDLHWEGDTPFLVMELLPGETLAAHLARGPMAVEDAVAIGLSIVEGLAHAHARDVIHRDLKPGNVMLTPFGPKIFDFGIAKRLEPAMPDAGSILGSPGTFVGSASYTSPEQAEGLRVDARSDIFSVGCVLYEMVTGVKAFDGASRLSILAAVLRAEPRDISEINPSVPLAYTRAVARCLQKEPSRRFQRTTDLQDVLDRLARRRFGARGVARGASLASAAGDSVHADEPDSAEPTDAVDGYPGHRPAEPMRTPPGPVRSPGDPVIGGNGAERGEVRGSSAPGVRAVTHDAAPPARAAPRLAAPASVAGPTGAAPRARDAVRDDGGAGAAADTAARARQLAPRVLSRGNRHPMCLMVSAIYGLMAGLALLVEIAYEWPTFGSWALPVAALTGALTTAVSLVAFAVLRRCIVHQRPHALLSTLAIFGGWSIVLALAIGPWLPERPLVRARIQTMTANVGYPKSLLEALALPVLALVPLQVVCALEAEVRRGRARNVYRILTSRHQRVSIPGTLVVRPNVAGIVFAVVTIWWMGANARLFESLENGPYYGLFLELSVLRVGSGLLMLFAVLAWYVWSVNDLRREAQQLLGR